MRVKLYLLKIYTGTYLSPFYEFWHNKMHFRIIFITISAGQVNIFTNQPYWTMMAYRSKADALACMHSKCCSTTWSLQKETNNHQVVVVGAIWTSDVGLGSSMVELLTRVTGFLGSIPDPAIYFHYIYMLFPAAKLIFSLFFSKLVHAVNENSGPQWSYKMY